MANKQEIKRKIVSGQTYNIVIPPVENWCIDNDIKGKAYWYINGIMSKDGDEKIFNEEDMIGIDFGKHFCPIRVEFLVFEDKKDEKQIRRIESNPWSKGRRNSNKGQGNS